MSTSHYTVIIDGYDTRVDTPAGSWHPDQEDVPFILGADDPKAKAIEMCKENTSGCWA